MLAFDFGTRRIGVAVGNTLLRVARPLTTIVAEVNAARFAAVAAASAPASRSFASIAARSKIGRAHV